MKTAALLLLIASPARAWWFGPKYKAYRPERPITLDGDARDWPPERRDDAGDMTFAFAQDDEFLYVLFAPHTKSAKQQLAGTYGQDMTLWVDPGAGMAKKLGVSLTAPQKTGLDRYVRVVTAAGPDPNASSRIDVKAGPFDERGVLEARVPLGLLSQPLPKMVSVGLETTKPAHVPLPVVDPKGRAPDQIFAPVRIWVRVTLLEPKR